MENEILDVYFLKKKDSFEFEFLTYRKLLNMKIEHILERSQRVHFHHIFLFTKGIGEHVVDFKKYSYKPKSLLFIAENQLQKFKLDNNSEGFLLIFTSNFLYKTEIDRKILQNFRIFDFSLQSPVIQLENDDYNSFFQLFQKVKEEFFFKDKSFLREEIIRNLLRVIILKSERLKQQKTNSHIRSFQNEFNMFRDQLEKDYPKTRNVKDYAFILRSNPKRLNLATKTILNQTAKEFIDNRVVLEIKRLLVHTDLSVFEIANQVGFDEPTNLIKFFKKHTQIAPLSFRAREK